MKKMLSLILTVLMVLSLAACGQKGSASAWQEQYDLGIRYLSEGSYEEAIIAFTAAIEIDPKQALAYIGRGDAYILSGETDEALATALADYEQALALDEADPNAYLGLADVYIRRGEYEKAMEVLKTGLEKTNGDSEISSKIAEIESGSYIDSAGNIRRMNAYDGSGDLIYYHTYAYGRDGRETSVTSFDSAGVRTGHVDMLYDSNGWMLTSYYWTDATGEVGRVDRQYDAAGNSIREDFYFLESEDMANKKKVYYINEYDEAGNEIRSERYEASGELLGYEESLFYADGSIKKRLYYSARGTLDSYFVWEYNENGDMIATLRYDGSGDLESKRVILYNDVGNEIGSETYDGNGNLIERTDYAS